MHLFIRGLQHQTEPQSTTSAQSGITWKDLDWAFRVLVSEPIPLHLWWWRADQSFLAPWMRLEVPVPVTERTATLCLPYGELCVHYTAQRKYDPTHQGIMVVGRISALEISFSFGPDAFWNAFAVMERHQLVARVRVGVPTQTPLAQQYLGRAQSVQTMEFARHRIYKWLQRPPEEVGEGELSPRDGSEWEGHAREARELQRISGRGSLIHITPRALNQPPPLTGMAQAEEMDNEAWSNPRRVLPVRLRPQDGGLKVQIFNLGAAADGDVPYADSCYLRWESFVSAASAGRIETDLTPHLKLTVHFELKAGDALVELSQLVLDAREYSQMLRHMGRCHGAKTI